MAEKRIIKFIPSELTLTETKRKQCTVIGCTSTFINLSNLQMHLDKHHKIPMKKIIDKNTEVHYFCPVAKCKYNVVENSSLNYFKTKKYLRQHFLKVHAKKFIKCNKCTKLFASETLKVQHERQCGIIFQCVDCNWKYTSRECLITHCKRKGHTVPPKPPILKGKSATNTQTKIIEEKHKSGQPVRFAPRPGSSNISNQTDILMKKVQVTLRSTPAARIKANFERALQKSRKTSITRVTQTTQTNDPPAISVGDVSKFSPIKAEPKSNEKYKSLELIDEESNSSVENANEANRNLNNLSYVEDESSLHYFTVSNFNAGLCHIETQTDLMSFVEENINSSDMDPLLCHMHTQTSDEILSELGLANIQTQTNWTDECNDLFVSTETQTCFENRLMMDNNSTQTQTFIESNYSNLDRGDVSCQWSDDIRHQSQCTQTQFE